MPVARPAVPALSFAVLLLALAPSAPARADWNPAGEPVPIANCQLPLVACLDIQGGLLSFWTVPRPDLQPACTDILARHQMPSGDDAPGWPAAGRTIASVRRSYVPLGESLAAAQDGAGGAWLWFRENRFFGSTAPLVHRLFHMLADGTLDPAWPDTGLVLGRAQFGGSCALAGDVTGGVYAAWLDVVRAELVSGSPAATSRCLLELRLARVTAAGAPAPGFGAEGLLVRGVAPESLSWNPQGSFSLVADGAGGALLAWADSSDGVADTRVWRYGPDGGPAGGWPAEGVTFTSTELTAAAGLVPDGLGGTYVAWTDSVPGFGSPRLLRLDGSGQLAPGWPAGGLEPASAGQPYHWMGGIAADGAGGVYAQLDEGGSGGPTLTRLVRRDAGGGVPAGWTAQGIALSDGHSGVSGVSQPVADAGGGVHAVWGMGLKPALFDVRVAFDGSVLPGWSAANPRATPVPGEWWAPQALGDAQGAVYVVGHSSGGPECDALAFQLGLREPPVAGVVPVPSAGFALDVGPNPAAGAVELGFTLPRAAEAAVGIVDALGRRVRAWRVALPAGPKRLAWDGRDDAGEPVPTGIYFASVRAGGESASRRVAIVR